jgi:hypothetical protein
MSNLPTPINLVDTETVQWTADNSNPRNVYANVATADASTHGAVLMTGDFGGSGESPAVVGIKGVLFDQSIAPNEDYQAPQFVADGVSDAGIAFGHLKFGHLTGGIDPRSSTAESIGVPSHAACVTLSDSSPAADIAVSLDSTVNAHFWCFVQNQSVSHNAVFTPSSGTINDGTGASSTATVSAGSCCVVFFGGTNWTILKLSGGGGAGTVTSVALTMPAEFSVAGSPITSSGTLAVTKANQSANQVFAGPTSGSPAVPSFRALVASDIPNIAESQVTSLTTDLAAKVSTSRTINTTAPITGGGDLSVDRTIAIDNFTGDSGSGGAKGAVPAPAAGDAAAGKFLKADGTWTAPGGSSSPLTTKGDLYSHSSIDARLPVGSDGAILTADAAQTIGLKYQTHYGVFGIVIDGSGGVPLTGSKGFIQMPYGGTITGWTIIADQSGSCQVTLKKSTYSGFPSTSSIVASAQPILSSAQKATSTTLTGWTTAFSKDDIMEFNLDSVTACRRLILQIQVSRN